jgi:HCNGP-like protein
MVRTLFIMCLLLSNVVPDIKEDIPTEPSAHLPIGPLLGPSQPLADMLESFLDRDLISQSPYSANRALLRDLTLPTAPNYDIPQSPPGSPIASTNTKFRHFLKLKKQGVHFNEKLSKSAALKNPSLMQKLMDFSDIDEAGQYATTLPKTLWNPNGFPASAYKEELLKSQQNILKKRENEKRGKVDFVPATDIGNSSSLGNIGQKSAAERIMAGLDRGRSSSPQIPKRRKTRFET